MDDLDNLMQLRIAQGLCVACGQLLDDEAKSKTWTTCLPCQQRMEKEAHEYWQRYYKSEEN